MQIDRTRRRLKDRQRKPAPVNVELAAMLIVLEEDFADDEAEKVPADD